MTDYRRTPPSPLMTTIKGLDIEIVEVIIDNKLSFQPNCLIVCKRFQQRLYFLRKLKSFRACLSMMILFYEQFIESVLSFIIVAWYGTLSLTYKNRPSSLCKGSREEHWYWLDWSFWHFSRRLRLFFVLLTINYELSSRRCNQAVVLECRQAGQKELKINLWLWPLISWIVQAWRRWYLVYIMYELRVWYIMCVLGQFYFL